MTQSQLIIILVIVGVYLLGMLTIGFKYSKVKTSEQYFLGGRGLNGWLAGFSAEASVMSGWMLLGFPGTVYAIGAGQIWCGIGCFLGSTFNYMFVASRLRKYSMANGSITVPQYMGRRFKKYGGAIQTISAIFIIAFFVVYAASGLISGGKLLTSLFNMNYSTGILVCTAVILIYTFLGGFDAVCTTDFIQGLIMLASLITVPIIAYATISGNFSSLMAQSGVEKSIYENILFDYGAPITAIDIISQLGWGLAYAGLPHIIVRFMAVKNERELTRTKVVGLTIDFVGLVAAFAIGIIGRAYLVPMVLDTSASETVYIEMIKKLFLNSWNLPVICGIFIAGIVASIMSSSDSMLLTSASTLSEDFYHGLVKKDADDKQILRIGRISIVVVAVLAAIFAMNPDSGVFKISSIAWAGLGATFAPSIILSLYWKRLNAQGVIAGMLTGGISVIIYEYVPLVHGQTLSAATSLYSIVPCFILSMLAIVLVTLLTPAPEKHIVEEFEKVMTK